MMHFLARIASRRSRYPIQDMFAKLQKTVVRFDRAFLPAETIPFTNTLRFKGIIVVLYMRNFLLLQVEDKQPILITIRKVAEKFERRIFVNSF
jgi:hypothetical protein